MSVNQYYFHVIMTLFSYLPSVYGLTHVKETHVATEHTIINSGLYVFKSNIKTILKCLCFTFRQIIVTVPFKYFNVLLQALVKSFAIQSIKKLL